MGDTETHPMTVFLHESADGNIAHSPPTNDDRSEQWVFRREHDGFYFNFKIEDKTGILGYQITAKKLEWIGHFVYHKDIEYLKAPPSPIQDVVENSVAIREPPETEATFHRRCPDCGTDHWYDTVPEIALVIDDQLAQYVFREQCSDCGTEIVEKLL